jgi:hypothetical protein
VEVWTLRAGIEDDHSWNSMINREFHLRPSRASHGVEVQRDMWGKWGLTSLLMLSYLQVSCNLVEVKYWDVKEATKAFITVRVSVYIVITPSWLNS